MSVVVGLDCGGSTTRLLAVDGAGQVVATAQAGPANLMTTPNARLRANLSRVAEGCPAAQAVCGCFAGLLGQAQREAALGHLNELFPGAKLRAEPDYAAALAAAPPDTQILAIAGTGSLVCSRPVGHMVKSGGRGYLVGDEGSAARIGLRAVQHYLDGPAECPEALGDALVRHFGGRDEATILTALYGDANPAPRLAKLAKAVARLTTIPEWTDRVHEEMGRLAGVIARHRRRWHADVVQPRLALAGGLWKVSARFGQALQHALATVDPEAQYVVARVERPPVEGAVALAREMTDGN